MSSLDPAETVFGVSPVWVVIGTSSGRSREEIMTVYSRHRAFFDELEATGDVIDAGPFADRGNLALFRSEAVARRFATEDPFLLEGMVASYSVHEWMV
jgi:uncharacterized protein YciI